MLRRVVIGLALGVLFQLEPYRCASMLRPLPCVPTVGGRDSCGSFSQPPGG